MKCSYMHRKLARCCNSQTVSGCTFITSDMTRTCQRNKMCAHLPDADRARVCKRQLLREVRCNLPSGMQLEEEQRRGQADRAAMLAVQQELSILRSKAGDQVKAGQFLQVFLLLLAGVRGA